MKTENNKKAEAPNARFPIIAIGGSAGGMEAMIDLLHALPLQTGMCFIYIQHLDPTHKSNLQHILSRETRIPVEEAADGTELEPDKLYVVTPNSGLRMEDGSLKLTPRPGTPYQHMAINQFFSSLAETHKGLTVGVLLSGTGNDGTIGLKAIKLAGGITIAQDSTAKFSSMPKNAAMDGAADLVLSPTEMGEELMQIARQKDLYYTALHQLDTEVIPDHDEELSGILHLLQRSTGVDFTQYKMNTVKRRIMRRMVMHKLPNLKEYSGYLKQHTREVNNLYNDLLINVTTFFRDREANRFLREKVMPELIKSKLLSDPIRVWVPACSTGQEAYSLAIMIIESLGEHASSTPVQIFATDLSEHAINKARLGIYSASEVAEVPEKTLQRFFTKLDGSFRIVKSIRDLCVFATHNIAKDPPFSRLDLISCCNLLIYLELPLQKKLIASFHHALNPVGFLVLGKSESIGTSAYLFSQLDKKIKVYSKKTEAKPKAMFELNYSPLDRDRTAFEKQRPMKMKATENDLEKAVDDILLKKFTPAAVVVNYDLDILQFRGATGLFLEPSPGKASLNLMKMARQSLGFELRNIVHKARRSGEQVKKTDLVIQAGGKNQRINIEAIPIKTDGSDLYYLVVFEETAMPPQEQLGNIKDKRVQQLEAELTALREDMRSIVESQEAANEELQSANEEIVSSNEELQSINEELETSKEEIESSNEELITINQELQVRNEQLAEVEEYSESIFSTLEESLLVLDRHLHVKKANGSFYKTFKVDEEDTSGSYLYDLGNGQWNIPELRKLLEEVIPRNSSIYGYEVEHNFEHIGWKVMRLNARMMVQKLNRQQLILLAIQDITEYKKAEKIIADREAWFRNMADNLPIMIWITGPDKLCSFVNKTYLAYLGVSLEEVIGKSWTEDCHPEDLGNCLKIYEESFRARKPFDIEYRLKKHTGQYCRVLSRAQPNIVDGKFMGYIGSCIELPDAK